MIKCYKNNVKVKYEDATIWMNLENIMLSEISQTQKDKYCMTPLIKYLE